ncbi:MAG: histidinol-phosphate aminotransferase family protein [Gammaproteobacteria bacterium]|nr:histidinol-phosphate aminotransferase family protein [Gammaproteobacteria bacterium]
MQRSKRVGLNRRALLQAGAAAAALLRPLSVSARQHQGQSVPGGMLRLIANENPYGPSPAARAAAADAVEQGWKYAIRETRALKKLIAEQEGVGTRNVFVCAGSTEALRVATLIYGRDRGRVVAANPTFSFLPTYARHLGCKIDEIALDENMRHDLGAMAAAVGADTRLLYVCNPNNPTGTLVDGADLGPFIDEVSQRVPVLVDEAYLDLRDDLPKHTAVRSVVAGKPVIVTRTFSKLHGMAGMRVGYAIAPPEIVERLEQLRVTQMSYPGVLAAAASLQDAEFLAFSRARIRECLDITAAVFDELGKTYVPSHGNFIYFDTGGSPRDFMGAMRGAGILTGMSYAPYPTWARVSMGRVEHMRAFADAVRAYFSRAA